MSTRVVLMLRTDGDRRERLLAFLSSMLPATRETQGCEGLFLCRSDTDPTMFVVDQRWASTTTSHTRDGVETAETWLRSTNC